MEEKCFSCACEIKKGISLRRKLYSSSSCHVLHTLVVLYSERFLREDVERLLPPEQSTVLKEDIFICIKCFKKLEKLNKIHKEMKILEESFSEGFENVRGHIQLGKKETTTTQSNVSPTKTTQPELQSQSTPVSRKRSLPMPPQPTRKRKALDTPIVHLSFQFQILKIPLLAFIRSNSGELGIDRLRYS